MAQTSKYKLSAEEKGFHSKVPVKIQIGAKNIRANAVGPAATLGRGVQGAFDELARDFGAFVNKLEGFLPEDLGAALEPTLELSHKYCPVLTGRLIDSSYLEMEQFRGGARAEIGYARGEDPPYAIAVHEIPAQHVEPTSDKFLQKAIDEDFYQILQRVTDRVQARLGG